MEEMESKCRLREDANDVSHQVISKNMFGLDLKLLNHAIGKSKNEVHEEVYRNDPIFFFF